MAASMVLKNVKTSPFDIAACITNKPILNIATNKINSSGLKRCKTTSSQPTSIEYCLNLVRKCDYENYLCTLLFPKNYRTSAFALRALYIELAQVQDVTSDKMRAIMRLQFWKDTLDNIYKGTPPQTPVALEVAKAVEQYKLSKLWFTRILETRANQISQDLHRTLKEVEDAGENTSSTMTYLLLELAGIKNVNVDHAASHLGRCHSLVTLLRATPFHISRNKVYIPIELLVKHNVSQEQILRSKEDQPIKDVMYDIASLAHQHLETARSLKKNVPKEANVILINSIICEQYLKHLQLVDFNVFDKNLHSRNAKLPWLLWKQKFIKRTF